MIDSIVEHCVQKLQYLEQLTVFSLEPSGETLLERLEEGQLKPFLQKQNLPPQVTKPPVDVG